jgi:superfamily II RNA helicase
MTDENNLIRFISPPPTLDLKTLFPFKLDDFQKKAIAYLEGGKSVVVTAPTGSGKTLIGEFAIYRALSREKRVFYTTPLKALSNQKFRDFQEKFAKTLTNGIYGEIGLITGDILINPDAPIVVMTTEIFRNMLYSTPIGEVGTSLDNVETVVLDECHYISDQGRGTVWEESIIYCPPHIQLLGLSATVGNPEQLQDWINRVRKAHFSKGEISYCELVNSNFRPVPLNFYFSNNQGLFNLLNSQKNKLNPRLKAQARNQPRGKFKNPNCPSIKMVVQQLENKNMLPAIYIIFSRRGCDRAVIELSYLNLVTIEESKKILLYLLYFLMIENIDLQEKIINFAQQENSKIYYKIKNFIENKEDAGEDLVDFLIANPLLKNKVLQFLGDNSELVRNDQIEPLNRGIAAHHAGILPAWKELVERLFELGLVKIVFATATLAAGINMPARTTVISALKKRSDDGHRLLTPSEFLQIAGRAGRRGMDEVGYVVTVQTPFEGALEAARLAKSSPEPLRSWFTPSYGMVLNLLQKHTIEEAKQLLEMSFAEYLAQLQLGPEEEAIASYTTELTKLDIELAEIKAQDLASYEKLKDRIKQEKKLLKLFNKNLIQQRKQEIFPTLENLSPGAIISLKGQHKKSHYSAEAVFVAKIPGSGKAPYLLCLADDNYWYVAAKTDVMDVNQGSIPHSVMEKLFLPTLENVHLGKWLRGDELTAFVSQLMREYKIESVSTNPDIMEQEKRIKSLEKQFQEHPLREVENLSRLLKSYQKRQTLKQQLKKIQRQYQRHKSDSSYYWQEFMALVQILREFDALDEFTPTPLGEAAAVIRGENELWLGLALMSRRLDFLAPHHLASAIAALITEQPRFDVWSNYLPSPEVLDALGLKKREDSPYNGTEELWELRRKLYQAQAKYDIVMPVWLERDLIGLVEAWCLGVEWNELCENTTLDEGDLVRILRRTVDVLWQIPQVIGVSVNLIKNAKEAIAKMKRFPI